MRSLVRRYITCAQRIAEQTGSATEDDVNEMKHEIATFKYELFDLLRKNGMKTDDKLRRDEGEAIHQPREVRSACCNQRARQISRLDAARAKRKQFASINH